MYSDPVVAKDGGDGGVEGGKKPHKTPQKWSEEEERLFLEGLELYGREWEKV